MSEAPNGHSPNPLPGNLGKLVLEPLDHGLASMARQALKLGVPTHNVVEMLLNHLASVVAMIEPPGARAATTEAVTSQFSGLVHQHVEARKTTAGGVRIANTMAEAVGVGRG